MILMMRGFLNQNCEAVIRVAVGDTELPQRIGLCFYTNCKPNFNNVIKIFQKINLTD